ncbi:DUF4258 domain-containing protein [Methanospirillum purgamenti]|uniref:DUF4258 domain-containing protein n=1 Tax=Methanospirillum hungatei TaxID=2203 RepID=A0A8F5VPB1_METHU|nr:DUF4258 domain-containing protein [Methanospirillum hungatei]QXO95197.1 DUF4258 domain-containing protein [Methanospirillum hungatei]
MRLAPEQNLTSTLFGTGSGPEKPEDNSMELSDKIDRLVDTRSIIFSSHARTRMFERDISSEDILPILTNGEIIETYEDDTPCPSYLILGYIHDTAIHIVIAVCVDHIKIVTVYHPDDRWTHHKIRRQ